MDMKRLISLSFALVMAVYAGGRRSRRSQCLCRLLSKGPKRCRDPRKSRRSPSVGLGPRVTVRMSSVSPKPAMGSRVPSHRAQARARFSRERTMWGCVMSAGREHERSGESRPRLIVRSRLTWRALGAGKIPRV
jgi:hypothetical protein